MKWAETPQTVLSMVAEFKSVLQGGPRDVTIDYTSPDRDRELGRLRDLDVVTVVGDVASYYLPYVPLLASLDADIRMPCLRRDKAATIKSFIETVRRPNRRKKSLKKRMMAAMAGKARKPMCNHWIEHDGSVWQLDMKWDKCFPKFEAANLEEAIGLYWEDYRQRSDEFAAQYPEKFRVFDIDVLNSAEGQAGILEFCGFETALILENLHLNRSAK